MLQIAFDKENCSSGNQQLLKSARTREFTYNNYVAYLIFCYASTYELD